MPLRWFTHHLGIRDDNLAQKLWYAQLGVFRLCTGMTFGPTVLTKQLIPVMMDCGSRYQIKGFMP